MLLLSRIDKIKPYSGGRLSFLGKEKMKPEFLIWSTPLRINNSCLPFTKCYNSVFVRSPSSKTEYFEKKPTVSKLNFPFLRSFPSPAPVQVSNWSENLI